MDQARHQNLLHFPELLRDVSGLQLGKVDHGSFSPSLPDGVRYPALSEMKSDNIIDAGVVLNAGCEALTLWMSSFDTSAF